MRIFLYLWMSVAMLTSCSSNSQPTPNQPQPAITLLAPKDFAHTMETQKGILLDVRTPGEYKKGHLTGARLLDLFSDEFETEINKLDTAQTYFIYCGIGGRSAEVCELMEKKGFKHLYDMDGGFVRWKQEGLSYEQ